MPILMLNINRNRVLRTLSFLLILGGLSHTFIAAVLSQIGLLTSSEINFSLKLLLAVLSTALLYFNRASLHFRASEVTPLVVIHSLAIFVFLVNLGLDLYTFDFNALYYLGHFIIIFLFSFSIPLTWKYLPDVRNILLLLLFFLMSHSFSFANTYSLDKDTQTLVDTARLQLPSLNPISLGYFSSLFCVILVWSYIRRKLHFLLFLPLLVLGVFVLLETNSRSTIIAVCFAILFMLPRIYKYTVLILFTIFSLLMAFTTHDFSLFFFSRALSIHDPSVSARIEIYNMYFDSISSNLFLPAINPEVSLRLAHNIFLGVYSASTIIGLIFFLIVNFIAIRKCLYLSNVNSEFAWIGPVFFITFCISFFSGAYFDLSYWLVLTIVFAYASKEKNAKNNYF